MNGVRTPPRKVARILAKLRAGWNPKQIGRSEKVPSGTVYFIRSGHRKITPQEQALADGLSFGPCREWLPYQQERKQAAARRRNRWKRGVRFTTARDKVSISLGRKMQRMLAAGRTKTDIARETGRTRKTVIYVLNKMAEYDNSKPHRRS